MNVERNDMAFDKLKTGRNCDVHPVRDRARGI